MELLLFFKNKIKYMTINQHKRTPKYVVKLLKYEFDKL